MKYDTLKALVNAKVYENTEQRITGGDMNDVLQSAIASLGAHYQMGGLVSPTDQITVGDEPVVFLATTPGTYTYFGGLVVADGEVALLVWSGTAWSKQTSDIATRTELNQLGQELNNKLDKRLGTNLINPDTLAQGKYIKRTGEIADGGDAFYISDFIPINGNNISMCNACVNVDAIRPWVAFDIDGNITRVGGVATEQSVIYTFDSVNYPNDYYIRFGFQSDNHLVSETRANYGSTLADYVPYTDYKPLEDLKEDVQEIVDDVEGLTTSVTALEKEIDKKVDEIIGTNLINPSKLTQGKYIRSTGEIADGGDAFYISDFIPINGNNISMYFMCVNVNAIRPWVAYDENLNITRVGGVPNNETWLYEFDSTNYPNDKYLRIGFQADDGSLAKMRANYGTTLADYIPYTQYKPIEDLDKRVTALEQGGGSSEQITLAYIPNAIYSVYNSILTTRQYVQHIYMSHLLNSLTYLNKELFFENFIRNMAIIPSSVATKSESSKTITITPKKEYAQKTFSTKIRMVNSAASKSVTPKILVIGDSVTDGYGANSNKNPDWLPNTYWAYCKMLFEMDKIDGGDNANEYNALMIGTHSVGNFTIEYDSVTRLVRAMAEGYGGSKLDEYFTAYLTNNTYTNPFYDSVNDTFSINAYLAKYRTMDDLGVRLTSQSTNPAGESVIGSDGLTYTIGTQVTDQTKLNSWDACKPTHIVINLNHNTSLAEFQTYAPQVISIIQSELPNVPIIFMTIDETGGYFPCDYPNYNPSDITYGNSGLHVKNGQIYNYIKNSLENESNGIYLLGAQFIQSTAESYPTISVDTSKDINRVGGDKFEMANETILGRTYHPNNLAHSAFGYALYAMIKWLIS